MYNVLLVDDNVLLLDDLKTIIRWEDYGFTNIECAVDGNIALDIMSKIRVDLLITDIKMPNMDGIALLKKVNLLYKTRCVLLTAYGEFDYAREALKLGVDNYLLKPLDVDELTSTVEKIANDLSQTKESQNNLLKTELFRSNVLSRWLNGTLSGTELYERTDLIGINLFKPSFCVILIRPKSGTVLPDINGISTMISDNAVMYQENSGDYSIIIGGSDLNINKIKNDVKAAYEKFDLDVFTVIGTVVDECESLCYSYHAAVDVLNCAMLFNRNEIVSVMDVKSTKINHIVKIEYMTLLDDSITDKDVDLWVERIIDSIINNYGYSTYVLRALLIELIININRSSNEILSLKGYSVCPLQDDLKKFNSINSRDDLVICICDIIKNMRKAIVTRDCQLSPLTQRVVEYINKQYQQEISLAAISDKWKVNAKYLGRIFKNDTGLFFYEYLNQVRLKHAYHMLLNTDMTTSDISTDAGFMNVSYFYKCFKTRYGMPPVKYRYLNKTES